jgi:hypothetical protein
MSKILKNDSGSNITVSDTGITINNSSQYTIPPQDYLLWAASSDVITEVGAGNLVVNDGSFDLSISDGIDLIKGIFPQSISINNDTTNPVKIDTPNSAFGEILTAQLSPYVNVSASKGLLERTIETYTSGTGSFAGIHDHAPGREFEVESGTSVGGYGVLRSKKVLDYHGGIGSLARFTAKFSTPVANSILRAGFNNIGNELAFGYSGTTFGILKKTGGRPEIRTLTITQRATSSQTATVTLNGVAYNISVTNSSIEQNAYEIAQGSFTGWNAYNIGSTVLFQSTGTGAKSNTYSLTSTGNLAGTFAQTAAGLTEIEEFISQSNWNITTLTTSDDPFILNPQKGNVYQIQLQYLGYGAIRFYVENPNNGNFILVHRINYANANTSPSLDIPHFKLGIIAASMGSTTNVSVSCASMSAFNENQTDFPGKTHSYISSTSGIGTSLTNLLAFKKITVTGAVLNISDVKLLGLTLSSEATNPVIFELRLNPSITGVLKWFSTDEDTTLITATDSGTVTNGEILYTIALSKSSNITIDLTPFDLIMSNDDVLTISVRATNGTVAAAASLIWGENT